jgi:hypothetical protein
MLLHCSSSTAHKQLIDGITRYYSSVTDTTAASITAIATTTFCRQVRKLQAKSADSRVSCDEAQVKMKSVKLKNCHCNSNCVCSNLQQLVRCVYKSVHGAMYTAHCEP